MVVADVGELMFPAEGPLVFIHEYKLMVAPLVPLPVPASVIEFVGSVIVCALPAFATGAVLINGFTVIVTLELFVNPWLSVTVSV